MKIRKGDRVRVLSGKDKGKDGVVLVAMPAERRVIVEGVAVAKRHRKSRGPQDPGGIIDKNLPIDVSNVAIVCPSCGKPTRVGYRFEADGEKVRVCRKCSADVPAPKG